MKLIVDINRKNLPQTKNRMQGKFYSNKLKKLKKIELIIPRELHCGRKNNVALLKIE